MPKNMDNPVEWLALGLLVLLMIGAAIATSDAARAVGDPNDKSRVYLHQLRALAQLSGSGQFRVLILRQSGNVHAEYLASTAEAAIAQAISTFRRAKIDYIRISRNSPGELYFNRLFYSHRGSAEGKKVGSVQITRLG